MKIAVYHNLPHGGARRVMLEQMRLLSVPEEAVFTFSPDDSGYNSPTVRRFEFKPRKLLGSPFGRLNGLVNLSNLLAMQRKCAQVARIIESEGYDVVLVEHCSLTQSSPILRYLRTPTVYVCHEPLRAMLEAPLKGGPFLPARDPLLHLYSWAVLRNEYLALLSAKVVLCNSYYSHEQLLRTYGVEAVLHYPGVDCSLFSIQSAAKENMVLSVGRLSAVKGHDFIIESLARIPQPQRPVLHIACGPSSKADEDRLDKLARELGVELVLEGNVTDAILVGLYNRAKVTAFAPMLEPLGLVPLESMACGTPVVGVAEGGVRETVVVGVTGLLTQRDPEAFGLAIKKLLDDPEMASRMGSAGRDMVMSKWSWEKSLSHLQAILEKAAKCPTHHE